MKNQGSNNIQYKNLFLDVTTRCATSDGLSIQNRKQIPIRILANPGRDCKGRGRLFEKTEFGRKINLSEITLKPLRPKLNSKGVRSPEFILACMSKESRQSMEKLSAPDRDELLEEMHHRICDLINAEVKIKCK